MIRLPPASREALRKKLPPQARITPRRNGTLVQQAEIAASLGRAGELRALSVHQIVLDRVLKAHAPGFRDSCGKTRRTALLPEDFEQNADT